MQPGVTAPILSSGSYNRNHPSSERQDSTVNIEEIARIAYDWLRDENDAATLTAIDMAESAGDKNAHGDPVSSFAGRWAEYSCAGYLSWGLGQVFLGVHHDLIARMSGLRNPCDQAEWLQDADNNMRAQAAILANQGFQAWSTFKIGAHKPYLEAARRAVANIVGRPVAPVPGRPDLTLRPGYYNLAFRFVDDPEEESTTLIKLQVPPGMEIRITPD